ncbi:MAG: hypothetical protein ACR2NR_19570 [Solirubrobacteraceae bacterium]
MIRQRINLRTPALAYAVRLLTVVLALALFWYGLMIVLLAVNVSPHTVNQLSAYRTLYHDAADIKASDFTTAGRLIAGFAGLLVFLVGLYLASREIPRPYLARGEFRIGDRDHGDTTVSPRVVERVAEIAAGANPDVTSARGRLGDEQVDVSVHVRNARRAAGTLRDIQHRVGDSLQEHGLPSLPVNVTLTGYDIPTTRELA